jgi:hypothetical protein
MGLFSEIKNFASSAYNKFEFASGEIEAFELKEAQAGFETTWNFGGTVAGNYGKAIACGLYPTPCAAKIGAAIPELAAYHIPKLAFEGTSHIGSKAANWLFNPSAPLDPKSLAGIMQKFYLSACDEAAKFSLEATSQVTKKTIEEITNEYLEATAGSTTASTFKAVDLVGPALFLSLCTNKATRNLFDTMGHLKLLATGNWQVREAYTVPSNNSMSDIVISRVKHYKTTTLARDIAMEALFTCTWGAAAYFTYNGIHSAVLAAAAENEQAKIVTNAILITGWVAPTVFGWVKEALFTPSIIPAEDLVEENEEYVDLEKSLSQGDFANNMDIIKKFRTQSTSE